MSFMENTREDKKVSYRTLNYDIDWSEIFYYDPTSNSGLRWNISKGRGNNEVKIGDTAGHLSKRNKWYVGFNGKVYLAHIIIWKMFNDLNPDLVIDHIDRDSSNNTLSNLREISQKSNCRNKKKFKNNTSGVTGVSYHKRDAYWSVSYTLLDKIVFEKFYVKDHEDAFTAAVKRKEHLNKTILRNHGYTEQHGE